MQRDYAGFDNGLEVDTWGSFGGACRLDHGPSAVIRRAINTKSDWCG